MSTYRDFSERAKNEAMQSNIDDKLLIGKKYFDCGYHPSEPYYNNQFAVAVAIIGRLCGERKRSLSDYKNGIAYIAKTLKISKRQVKALRKKMKVKDGFVFKTPVSIPEIVKEMISFFQDKRANSLICKFLDEENPNGVKMYRTLFIEKQYSAIEASARASSLNSLQEDVYIHLSEITNMID